MRITDKYYSVTDENAPLNRVSLNNFPTKTWKTAGSVQKLKVPCDIVSSNAKFSQLQNDYSDYHVTWSLRFPGLNWEIGWLLTQSLYYISTLGKPSKDILIALKYMTAQISSNLTNVL